MLRQPASADFWVLSTYFCYFWILYFLLYKLKTSWEKKKSAEAGCLKILSRLNFFCYNVLHTVNQGKYLGKRRVVYSNLITYTSNSTPFLNNSQ